MLFVCAISVPLVLVMVGGSAKAQQVPIRRTAAEVPGSAPGTAMTKAYVQSVARMAYLWWLTAGQQCQRPRRFFESASQPGLLGRLLPIAHNSLAMLTNYVSPEQRFVTCPKQDGRSIRVPNHPARRRKRTGCQRHWHVLSYSCVSIGLIRPSSMVPGCPQR
jgi:hypothetical protein